MVMTAEELEEALDIPMPTSKRLVLDDYRRLTGPGLLWRHTGAILDVLVDGIDPHAVVAAWQRDIKRVFGQVGWANNFTVARLFDGGLNLAISAPVDQLYSAYFVARTALHFATCRLLGEKPGNFARMIADLKRVMAAEANPALVALKAAAAVHGIDFLSDDDHVSLGHGKGSTTWPVRELPAPADVDWATLHNLPVALITGTNGKSTSVRLSAAIAEAAGMTAGTSSTDYVKVGSEILDYGDYSGPGGARMLLRDKRTEIAFLEVARGGILRRGLPLYEAQAALVTNVAADHLGQYGVNTVDDLADAKFAVARAVARDGTLVLNADDALVVKKGLKAERPVCWFSLDADNPQITHAVRAGHPACWLEDRTIIYFDGQIRTAIMQARDIPITMDGAAKFNIRNAMGAICLARALNIADSAIVTGLKNFKSLPEHNPGRCNEFHVKGARVFVDFAHNPHSVEAVSDALSHMGGNRRFLLIGHAGDRSDQDIRDLTKAALAFRPDTIVAFEMEDYLRGRTFGEVSALIVNECDRLGLPATAVSTAASPSAGAAMILERLQAGDLALMLVLSERNKVFDMLRAAG